jgi:cytochrome c-type biogenesis protein CcmE
MRGSTVIPVVVSMLAIGIALAVFSSGATPYITVKQARQLSGDRLNLGVDIDKATLSNDFQAKTIEFDAIDKDGDKIHVKYLGPHIDLSQVERVTCVGKLEGDTFISNQIMVKCPSKYDEQGSNQPKS